MIELSPDIVCIIMFGGLVLGVLIGYPLAFVIGTIGLIVGYALLGAPVLSLIYSRLFSLVHTYTLLAVPLFVFMGIMLERSGTADKMYEALYLWLSGFRGGLAIITILIGTILAACVGIIGASVTILTLIALPSMLARGYNKSLATGSVCAGGTLGQLIPPSLLLVIYGPMATISVGKLFMGAIFPGFVLSGLYCSYIALRCLFQPKLAQVVPFEERAIPFVRKLKLLITSLVPPSIIIMAVLGVIFLGIAPPTEAAAVGAFATVLLAVVYRRFSWQVLKETAERTLKISSMIFFLGAMSYAFVGVFLAGGGAEVVSNLILGAPFGKWGAFAVSMFAVFILGFFVDIIGIIFIIVPIISPLIPILGFNPLWFAIMVNINFQMAYMTPPFALAIFYLRGSASPEWGITTAGIIRGVIPFVMLIIVGLGLCIAFPQIILWLPGKMIA